jgi:hypothetical protein
MKRLAVAILIACAIAPARVAYASGRVVEPSSSSVKITYDAQGKPKQFTIKVKGFQPNQLVSVEQCDGKPVTDPTFVVTTDCDTATVSAQVNADAKGVATFPANDPNYGFQPVRGASPQSFFNCVGPGDPKPVNQLPTYSVCQIRVASSYVARTTDEVFFPIDFGGKAANSAGVSSSSSSSSSHTWIYIVVIVVVIAAIVAGVFLLLRRRQRAAT